MPTFRFILIATLATACGHIGGFRCPARGGPAWREYRSRHFLLDTDLSDSDAQVLIEDLETLHALELQAMLGEQVEIPGHVLVVVPAEHRLFAGLADAANIGHRSSEREGGPTIGGYFKVSPLGQPMIVLPRGRNAWDRETIAHELVHHISAYLFPMQPPWFAEGLATFIQTVANPLKDDGQAGRQPNGGQSLRAVGLVPKNMEGALIHPPRPVPARHILTWNGQEIDGSFHLWSWILYDCLWNTRGKQLSEFQRRLTAGEEPAKAWLAAFPGFDPANAKAMDELDGELHRFLRSARYGFVNVTAAADTTSVSAPLSSAQVHVVLLDATLGGPNRGALLDAVDEMLSEDPGNPRALDWRAQLDKTSALEPLRRSRAERPSDAIAWLLLSLATTDPAEKESALRKAVELDPESSLALNNLAWLLVKSGRASDALPFADRALDLAPWSQATVDTLAEVAVWLGKCQQAIQLIRRAQWQRHDDEKARKRAADVEARCQ